MEIRNVGVDMTVGGLAAPLYSAQNRIRHKADALAGVLMLLLSH